MLLQLIDLGAESLCPFIVFYLQKLIVQLLEFLGELLDLSTQLVLLLLKQGFAAKLESYT